MNLSIIVAMTKNRVIGKDNDMPWHLSDDLKNFKKTTIGKTVIMGRLTYKSIGKPLPNRKNIILSRNLIDENVVSIDEKPKHAFFVNAGIYILNPECIKLVPKKFYDMPSLFKKIISNNKKTISFPLEEYWLDIGRLADYNKANTEYYSVFNEII